MHPKRIVEGLCRVHVVVAARRQCIHVSARRSVGCGVVRGRRDARDGRGAAHCGVRRSQHWLWRGCCCRLVVKFGGDAASGTNIIGE